MQTTRRRRTAASVQARPASRASPGPGRAAARRVRYGGRGPCTCSAVEGLLHRMTRHRYEQDTGDGLHGDIAPRFGDAHEILIAEGAPEGQHEPPPVLELGDQRWRDVIHRGGDQDRIEGSGLRPAEVAVAPAAGDGFVPGA